MAYHELLEGRRLGRLAWGLTLSLMLTGATIAATPSDHPIPVPPTTSTDTRFIVLDGMKFRPGVDPSPSFTPALAEWKSPDNPYFLVRFAGPLGKNQIQALDSAGAKLLDSLSFYTQLVRIDPAEAESLRQVADVVWVGPWTAGMKSSPHLLATTLERESDPGAEQHFLIYPQRDRSAAEILPELQELTAGKDEVRWVVEDATVDGTGVLRVTFAKPGAVASTLVELARVSGVFSIKSWAEALPTNSWNRVFVQGGTPPFVFQQTPSVTYTGVPWTGMPEPGDTPQPGDTAVTIYPIHARGLLGAGECVALIDTGLQRLDYFEPFRNCSILTDCSVTNWDAKVVCHHRIGASNCTDEGDSCSFHGTHTAGTVAGDLSLNPDGGYDFGDGIAPRAKLVMQDSAAFNATIDRCPFEAIDLADLRETRMDGTDGGGTTWQCRIHNDSWGASISGYAGSSVLFDEATWDSANSAGLQQDWLPVIAAGNDGPQPQTVGRPATAKNALTVGAADGGIAGSVNILDFSSIGPTTDGAGRIKPDVVSTGCALSACGDDDDAHCTGWNGFVAGQGVSYKCGTSMAAPTVAGGTALVRQYLREGWYPCGTRGCSAPEHTAPSAALLKAMIINGTRVPEGSIYNDTLPTWGDPVPNSRVGFGWVNLENSLYFDGDRLQLKILADRGSTSGSNGLGLETGETHFYQVYATGAEPLRIILAWTDPQGNTSGDALVNDLDLRLTAPDGTTYRGNSWKLDFLGQLHWYSKPDSTTPDNVNNVEGIYLPEPAPGIWTVMVDGANVPGRAGTCDAPCSQGYALVASGRFFPDVSESSDGYLLATEYGISGGCDGDAFLDNGERATLQVRLKNFGSSAASIAVVSPLVASDSTLPASHVSISPSSRIIGNIPAGSETAVSFQVRFLKHPDNLAGEYLKLRILYSWGLGEGSTEEFLSIPLQVSPAATPFYNEDFESATPGESAAGWNSEWGDWTCNGVGCDAGTFSGYMPGPPPQVVSCEDSGPRQTVGQELKFGLDDCNTTIPCCRAERADSPDLFLLFNQMTELSYYFLADSPSWSSGLAIDPDGAAVSNFDPYKATMPYSSTGNRPWIRFRADLRALQKIRGVYFNLRFVNGSGGVPLATEQGSLFDDIKIDTLNYDPANSDAGPPDLATPALGAVDVSVRPDLVWDHVTDHGGRSYSARVCTDHSCNNEVWSETGLTGNVATVKPSLESLTLHYWQTMVEDDCAIGDWGDPWSFTSAQADFGLTIPTGILVMQRNSSDLLTATVDWLNGYDGDVTLSCANLPANLSCAFTANPLPWVNGTISTMTEMTLSAGDVSTGSYTIQVVATGTIDGMVETRHRVKTIHIEGGPPGEPRTLNVGRTGGGDLEFTWVAPGCDEQDFTLYVGDLDLLTDGVYNHDTRITCSTGGAGNYPLPLETYVSDDFQSDLEGWHVETMGCATNMWSRTDQCTEGTWGLYFGDVAYCSYKTQALDRVCGAVVSPALDLRTADYATLTFDYLVETEPADGRDIATLEFSKAGLEQWTVIADNQGTGVGGLIDDGEWHQASIPFGGTRTIVELRFTFDSVDGARNAYRGFLVDNVAINNMPTNAYFLGTARNLSYEGSYGRDSAGVERPVSDDPCRSVQNTAVCP